MGWVWLRVLLVGSIRRVVFCWEEDGHDWQGFFVNMCSLASQDPLQPVVVMQSCEVELQVLALGFLLSHFSFSFRHPGWKDDGICLASVSS